MKKILIALISLVMSREWSRNIFYRHYLWHLPYRSSGDTEYGYGLFGLHPSHSGPWILYVRTHAAFKENLTLKPTHMETGFRLSHMKDRFFGSIVFTSPDYQHKVSDSMGIGTRPA